MQMERLQIVYLSSHENARKQRQWKWQNNKIKKKKKQQQKLKKHLGLQRISNALNQKSIYMCVPMKLINAANSSLHQSPIKERHLVRLD